MSSVTPSDSGYNTYYMKHLTDLEDELKQDSSRVQQNAKERADEAENKWREATVKHEEKTNETVERMNDEHAQSALRSRETERAELDRVRRQSYDRFGRNRGNEADITKQQLVDATESARTQHEADLTRLKDTEKAHENQTDKLTKQYGERLDRSVAQAKESSNEAFHNAFETGKSAADQQREEANKKYMNLDRDRMEDVAAQRRQTEKVVEDSKRDLDNANYHSDASVELRLNKDHAANAKRIEDNALRSKTSHDAETSELRDKLSDLMSAEDHYVKEYGQGKRDAVHDYEDNWRTRERVTQEANEAQVKKLHEEVDVADSRAAHKSERSLHDKDTYFTGLLSKKATESREEQKSLTSLYEKNHAELETQVKADKQRSQVTLENQNHAASEQRSEALLGQAKSYQETIANQRALDSDQINKLQADLKAKDTPTNDMEISPAVENAVRRSIVKQYEKTLNAETDRNKRQVENLQKNYSDRFQNAEMDHTKTLTDRERLLTADRFSEQARFLDHVQDTEYQKNESIRRADDDHGRETDNLTRSFTQSNMRQRADYESVLTNAKDDASSKINAIRQEADFNSKTLQRSFATKQNELIREYEKKLADQKIDFDGRMEETKSQSQLAVRDTERHSKVALEEQARGYEQRLAQFQVQQKERERSIGQNYEDELEKVKRSNALLQQKKS